MKNSFYPFLGIHSFLIGLFPFYIPVFLYSSFSSVQQVCIFVAMTGLGYCVCLYIWDRIRCRVPLSKLIIISYISEIILLSCFFGEMGSFLLLLAGLFNGIFNCNFWIIQRLLFIETIDHRNSGRRFGNFQLFVMIILKAAIFIGGIVLENLGFPILYALSFITVGAVSIYFLKKKLPEESDTRLAEIEPIRLREVWQFNDRQNSRIVFVIDGFFLYLESYLWLITLYLIVQESFVRLGLLVILLTLFFGLIFIFIKNRIDNLPTNLLFKVAVVLYCFSWLMRSAVSEDLDIIAILLLLTLITFCTSIFRLVFNKRFFDNARHTFSYRYILLKSYYSQFFLIPFFLLLLLVGFLPGNVAGQLSYIYLASALASFAYLFYRERESISLNIS